MFKQVYNSLSSIVYIVVFMHYTVRTKSSAYDNNILCTCTDGFEWYFYICTTSENRSCMFTCILSHSGQVGPKVKCACVYCTALNNPIKGPDDDESYPFAVRKEVKKK